MMKIKNIYNIEQHDGYLKVALVDEAEVVIELDIDNEVMQYIFDHMILGTQ